MTMKDGAEIEREGLEIETALSRSIFMRADKIEKVQVLIDNGIQ